MTLWAVVIIMFSIMIAVLINQWNVNKLNMLYEIVYDNKSKRNCIKINVENRSIFPINHIQSIIYCENIVFGTKNKQTIDFSVKGKSKEEYLLPVNSRYCGRIDLNVEKCLVFDWFDFSYRSIKVNTRGNYYIYPQKKKQIWENALDYFTEGSDITYKHTRGNDVSEILQIREYRQGDSIKNIHWKLSAKSQNLLVKEADCPNDNSIMILFDYSDIQDRDVNNDILTAVLNISMELQNDRKGHTLFRMDTSSEKVVERSITEEEEYDVMRCEVLETEARKCKKSVADTIMRLNIFTQFAKIIYVCPKNFKDDSGIKDLEQCVIVEI